MSNKLRFPEYRNSWETRKIESFVTEMRGGASLTPSEILESGDYKIIPKKSIQAGGKIVIDDDCSYVTEEVFNKFENNQIDKSYLLVVLRDLVPTGPSIGYIVENDKVDNGILAQGVYGIKLSEELDEKYLIQFSNTPKYRRIMQKIMVGSTQVHIRNTTFLNVEIPYTCLEEQQKIADFLSSVDDIITASEKEVATLEEQKKGVMQKIFSQEVRFKADDGSDYPEWESKPLEDNFQLVVDNRGKTPPLSETGYPLIEIAAVGEYFIKYDKIEKWVSQEIYNTWFRKHLKKGDILFSTVGNTAQCSYYDEKEKCCVAQNIVGLRFNEKIDSRFMFYLLTETKNNRYIKSIQMNGVQPSVKVTQFIKLPFSVPCLEEQQKIADLLSDFDTAIDLAKQELEQWKELKKGLLQQLFE